MGFLLLGQTILYISDSKVSHEWATTKQACRDELVVYLSFSSIYTTLYFYVFSTVYENQVSHSHTVIALQAPFVRLEASLFRSFIHTAAHLFLYHKHYVNLHTC